MSTTNRSNRSNPVQIDILSAIQSVQIAQNYVIVTVIFKQ
jgi:hypothetical protein